jgi:hypothetical protein
MNTRRLLAVILIFVASGFALTLAGGGPNFDHLADADRKILQERFVKEIWPFLERGGKNGCVGCHNGKINSTLKMTGNPEKDFRMLVKDGFFIPDDTGSMLTRIEAQNPKKKMPPPGKGESLAKTEIERLAQFVADLDKKQQKKTK